MILGTGTGLYAYFEVGFYVAALVSAAVSLAVTLASVALTRGAFDFGRLRPAGEVTP
jgi:hypothetical protein